MHRVEKSIVVDLPVRAAYDQWTQFEEFPRFMEGVKEVEQLDDKHLRWRASVGGKDEEWTAEITDQIPDGHIAWRSQEGARNSGSVTFTEQGDGRTRIELELGYEPRDAVEKIGDALGVLERRVEGDLKRFKEFIEMRGTPTGGWRGEIREPGSEESAEFADKRVRGFIDKPGR